MGLFEHLPTQFATDHSQHGATWRAGNWNCRNFHGYFQSREVGAKNWCFQIYGFNDHDCSVATIKDDGEMGHENFIPIDAQDRITILGKKYGRPFWSH